MKEETVGHKSIHSHEKLLPVYKNQLEVALLTCQGKFFEIQDFRPIKRPMKIHQNIYNSLAPLNHQHTSFIPILSRFDDQKNLQLKLTFAGLRLSIYGRRDFVVRLETNEITFHVCF